MHCHNKYTQAQELFWVLFFALFLLLFQINFGHEHKLTVREPQASATSQMHNASADWQLTSRYCAATIGYLSKRSRTHRTVRRYVLYDDNVRLLLCIYSCQKAHLYTRG